MESNVLMYWLKFILEDGNVFSLKASERFLGCITIKDRMPQKACKNSYSGLKRKSRQMMEKVSEEAIGS